MSWNKQNWGVWHNVFFFIVKHNMKLLFEKVDGVPGLFKPEYLEDTVGINKQDLELLFSNFFFLRKYYNKGDTMVDGWEERWWVLLLYPGFNILCFWPISFCADRLTLSVRSFFVEKKISQQ